MSKVSERDLKIRYQTYTKRVKQIMRDNNETKTRSVAMAALEFNVTERTIINAINNRPGKGIKKK